jgi:hypothetical protein
MLTSRPKKYIPRVVCQLAINRDFTQNPAREVVAGVVVSVIACFRQPQPDVSLQLAASVLALRAREVKRPSFMETLGLAILVVIVAASRWCSTSGSTKRHRQPAILRTRRSHSNWSPRKPLRASFSIRRSSLSGLVILSSIRSRIAPRASAIRWGSLAVFCSEMASW